MSRTTPTQRAPETTSATLRRRLLRVAAVYLSIAAVLGVGVVLGFPALELGWEAQRLVLILLALALPVALTLAWAGEAAPRHPTPDSKRPRGTGARTAWREVQAEFFRLMDLHPGNRESPLADLAGREPALAEEVAALLKAHDARGALEELGDRIAGSVPGALFGSDSRQDVPGSTQDQAETPTCKADEGVN